MLQLGLQASLYFQLMSTLNKASPSMAFFPQILETPQVFCRGKKKGVERFQFEAARKTSKVKAEFKALKLKYTNGLTNQK